MTPRNGLCAAERASDFSWKWLAALAITVSSACSHVTPLGPKAPAAVSASALPDFVALVQKVGPAVVNLTTKEARTAQPSFAQPPGDEMPAPPRAQQGHGIGAGFIIDADGYIVTNAHMVLGAKAVRVRLPDTREYDAQIVGADRQTDIALIKIAAAGLPVVKPGDSSQLKAGEWVVAIGSPFGFENTITAGIVSAKGRSLPDTTFVSFIQTDVAVNPGNSGGPLLNMRGEVVGVNSQIYSRSGGYMGMSFAIPINVAMDVAKQLRAHGHVFRPQLGIGIQAINSDVAQSFKLKEARGALVTRVEPDSAAHSAGLQPGDVVLRYDGRDVAGPTDLTRMVTRTPAGKQVVIEVWRAGARHTLRATLTQAAAPQVPF
jgi:serine protease Do